MAESNYYIEFWFDADGFKAELLRRIALTSGTEENIERIAMQIMDEGKFVHMGKPTDILDAEFVD